MATSQKQSSRTPPNRFQLADEFRGAEIGNKLRTERLELIAERLGRSPGSSFPKLMHGEAELEGLYRFFSNDQVTPAGMLGPHVANTLRRCGDLPVVRAIHDSSLFKYGGVRAELKVLTQKVKGFGGHFTLLASSGREASPLGIAREAFFNRNVDKSKTRAEKRKELKKRPRDEKLSSRWEQGAIEVQKVMASAADELWGGVVPTVIHIMDCEGDDFVLFVLLTDGGCAFVIRGSGDRSLLGETLHVADALKKTPMRLTRQVAVSPRKAALDTKNRSHPARKKRKAVLEIRASTVEIARPQDAQTETESVTVNVVEVREAAPPAGEEPISWTIYTSEPVKTKADIAAVVDHYRGRWLIEEFFKALKSGCAVESRQLESAEGLQRCIAAFTPIAWHALLLRSVSRESVKQPASVAFSPGKIELIRLMLGKRRPLSASPTVRDVLLAIAAIGGHIRHNGDPGWAIIMRGYLEFLAAWQIWDLARGARGRKKR